MSLTVGTDSYISLTDANSYVSANYATTQTEYTSWNALTDGNKEAYLRKACKKIDRQVLRGIKALQTQTLQFPRAIKTDYWNNYYPSTTVYFDGEWYVQTATPQEVINAQVEEAIALIQGLSDRVQLQREGVKSFSLGSLSETFDGSKKSTQALQSDEAKEFLKLYLAGSVEIV